MTKRTCIDQGQLSYLEIVVIYVDHIYDQLDYTEGYHSSSILVVVFCCDQQGVTS